MLKLYKFRPLGDEVSVCRARRILETGEFWCSLFWELNDPMEGIYLDRDGHVDASLAESIRVGKANRVICSFCGESAFSLPTMWGYYANGFKGIAIEVKVEESKAHEVCYPDSPVEWHNGPNKEFVDRVLTTKLTSWKHENEYRFLDDSERACTRKIGTITAVYFGRPYEDIGNADAVINEAESLNIYKRRAQELLDVADRLRISCRSVKLDSTRVIVVPDQTGKM